MKMARKALLFFILFALTNTGCRDVDYHYSEIVKKQVDNFDPGYQEYCNLDLTTNFELNAVQSSFYGDYRTALNQASNNETSTHDPSVTLVDEFGIGDKVQQIKELETALKNPAIDEQQKASIQMMMNFLTMPTAEERFAKAKPVLAVEFITKQAKKYHFTLINEAHYNSQNRAFTRSLLKPLWDIGYRYLALETLTHKDSNLQERSYPIKSTGYYTRDSNFGNLVREALTLGYRLIPYESQNGHEFTLRDRDQAHNIYEQTWKVDKKGKVLIHAGYGHIFETGDKRYEPMGYQLKNLSDQDIFSIDQENMVSFPDSIKQHSYYREASKRFDVEEPTVFLDDQGKVIVDPISSLGMDVQVYHPETNFVYGRPVWMQREDTKIIPLSAEILAYEGSLIQALPKGEEKDAVPIDQFIISDEKVFLLKPGGYDVRIINCDGDLIATLMLQVN